MVRTPLRVERLRAHQPATQEHDITVRAGCQAPPWEQGSASGQGRTLRRSQPRSERRTVRQSEPLTAALKYRSGGLDGRQSRAAATRSRPLKGGAGRKATNRRSRRQRGGAQRAQMPRLAGAAPPPSRSRRRLTKGALGGTRPPPSRPPKEAWQGGTAQPRAKQARAHAPPRGSPQPAKNEASWGASGGERDQPPTRAAQRPQADHQRRLGWRDKRRGDSAPTDPQRLTATTRAERGTKRPRDSAAYRRGLRVSANIPRGTGANAAFAAEPLEAHAR